MIDYETFHRIKHYQQEGLKLSQIADKLQIDSRTVEKWMAEPRYLPRKGTARPSKLDRHKNTIIHMLERHPYTAVQCYQRIRDEEGYTGGYTTVKDFVRKVRPKRPQAFLSLAFAPGECGQVDWGHFGSIGVGETRRKLYFFAMVLCHSRMMYVEFTVSQAMEFFLSCHINAFKAFGAIPQSVMIDNLKTGVLSCKPGEDKVFHPQYQDFADHYGFNIKACGVRKANEKGRVENAVGYIKKNFLNGNDFTQFDQINPAVKLWLKGIANVRIHGQTRKRPVDLFEEEKAGMNLLPDRDYDVARVKTLRANKLFRVTVDSNRYSVPADFAGKEILTKLYPDRLCLYYKDKLIARHQRSFARHQDFEHPDHAKPLLEYRKQAKEQQLLKRFLSLSPKSSDYYQGLQNKRMNVRHHVQKIIALSEIYGQEATGLAIQDALQCAAYSCEYVANILEQRANPVQQASALHLTHREDLLNIELKQPDLSVYAPQTTTQKNSS